jgi:hypothetical protein
MRCQKLTLEGAISSEVELEWFETESVLALGV